MSPETLAISGALVETRHALELAGVPNAAVDARSLVCAALGLTRTQLLTRLGDSISAADSGRLDGFTRRRVLREPLQYVTGSVEFYGREFAVDNHVLIPRPETELLIEQALLRVAESGNDSPRILDVGTGSGILAVTMAAEIPLADVVAVDVSNDALEVARANAERHGVSDRIEFVSGSLLESVTGRFDVVLCNPPYVLTRFLDGPDVEPELAFEPRLALDGGKDGMDVYKQLMPELGDVLAPGGAAYIEIDPPVAEPCLNLAKELMPEASISVLTDLSGLERCMAIELESR